MRKQFHTYPVHLLGVREELTDRMASDSEHIFLSDQIPQVHPRPSIQVSFRTAGISEDKTTTKCWFIYVPETPYVKLHTSVN
jgi:hypothetical protein